MWLWMAMAAAAEPEAPASPDAPAAASEGGLSVWVGGGVSGGVQAFDSTGVTASDPLATQAEVDLVVGGAWWHARVDLDLHLDPTQVAGSDLVAYPSPFPEWAVLQLGRGAPHLRLGILNPNIGLEDWDPWTNYAPTYSTNFVYAGAGRFAGAEASLTLDGGYDVFAFGGYDVDWGAVGGGVGIATEQDLWSTWTGAFVYPQFTCLDDEACLYAAAAVAVEVYPADPLWISLDSVTGVKDAAFFSSNQLVVNVIPEAVAHPFVRGELLVDPAAVIGGPAWSAGAGVTSDPLGWLRIAGEGKASSWGGTLDPGAALVVSVHRPEPSPYRFDDPFAVD